MTGIRLFKLFVLLGFPFLGALYAIQFSNPFDPNKREFVVPFKVSKVPSFDFRFAFGSNDQTQLTLREPITVVNFWATWCPPCVEEFPAMMELQRLLEGKGVEFVFVSIDKNASDIADFLKKFRIELRQEQNFWDPDQVGSKLWGSTKFPETYVVRRDGWIVEKIIGAQQWTRPVVVEYFSGLAEKYQNLGAQTRAPFELNLIPRVWAQAGSDLPTSPLIHEQDKKQLEKLRKNIETASQNVQSAQAAYKNEERNLNEQKIVRDRKKQDLDQAQGEYQKVENKRNEISGGMTKTRDALSSEQAEKRRVESQIKSLQDRILDLQNKLEATKDELVQANKALNTRVTSIESLQKAQESTQEELEEIQAKAKNAKKIVDEKKSEHMASDREVLARERKLGEIRKQVEQSEKILDEQKNKLKQFEDLLKK